MEAATEVGCVFRSSWGPRSQRSFGQDFNFEFTMGPEYHNDPYHIPVMRSQFPRKIGVLYPELRDEIITAFDDNLNLNGNGEVFSVTENDRSLMLGDVEWKSVPALTTMRQIVCRASNRSFVGLPLCMYFLSSPACAFEYCL